MSRNISRGVALAAAALFLLVAAAGCGSGSSSDASSSTESSGGSTSSAALPASVQSSGVLEVASDLPFPPWEYEEKGKLTGFEVDIADAMAKELGVEAKFVQQPFESIIPALQAGKFPIAMSAISDTKEREKVVDFVDFATDSEGILVAKGNPKNITGPKSLCGLKLALVRGTIQAKNAEVYSERCKEDGLPEIQASVYQNDGVAQLTVQSGNADAATSDAAALAYTAKTVDNGEAFEVVNFEDSQNPKVPVGIALAKGQEEFREALVAALEKVHASGEYDRIVKKWGFESLSAKDVTVNGAIN